MSKLSKCILLSLCCVSQSFAVTDAGANSDTLDAALATENGNNPGIINFTQDVSLVSPSESNAATQVRAVNSLGNFVFAGNDITINGNGFTLNGNNANVRGFFVGGDAGPPTGSVTISDLTFKGCNVQGGAGQQGGKGMGAGGGLFIYQDTSVILNNCAFENCNASGGSLNNANLVFGGGGMKGSGANKTDIGGGGGFGGNGDLAGGGASDFSVGDASGSVGSVPGNNFSGGGAPGSSGVGGSPGNSAPPANIATEGQPGGFGGGGGLGGADNTGTESPKKGGNGGFGGGGGLGGSATSNFPATGASGGSGGFGGGGGSGGFSSPSSSPLGVGGNGGFGAGGGLGSPEGRGGFGGGDAKSPDLGGNGAGFGGAIFMMRGAELTINGSINFASNGAFVGIGGNPSTDPLAGFGVLGQDIFMMSGSTIIFDNSVPLILYNPIEGNQGDETPGPPIPTISGGLVKKGGQTLQLTGDNSFTGTTTVEGGTLQVEGSLVSDVDVEGPAVLLGSFDLNLDATGANGGILTNKGAFIASPQTNIAGLYINDGGLFQVDITPTGTIEEKTFVIGNADILSGDLQIFVGEGNYIKGTEYTLITGSVTGSFDNQANPTLIGPSATNLTVEVTTGSLILSILEDSFISSPNDFPSRSAIVINCLQQSNHPPGSDLALVLETIGALSIQEQMKVLPTLSARLYGSLEWINARSNSYSADLLTQHLSELCYCCDCYFSGWITGFGNMMNNHKTMGNLPPYNADASGVLIGGDYTFSHCFLSGLAFGYTHTDVLWKKNGGGGDTDTYYGALYARYGMGCFEADISVLGGGTCNELKRHLEFANIRRNARGNFWSYFFTGHLGLSSPWEWCRSTFEPFALADYHYYTHESFTEKGANSLNLKVKSIDQHFIRGEAGLKWSYQVDCGCYCYAPYLGLSWVGEFPIGKSRQPASFIDQTCVINVSGSDSDVHLGSPQAGIKWSHCKGASFLLGYKGLYNGDVSINEVEGRLEWIF